MSFNCYTTLRSLRGKAGVLPWIRRALAFALAWATILSSATSYAQGVIEDIRVQGLQRVSAESVFAALTLKVGDVPTQDAIARTIEAIFDSGNFADIEVGIDGTVLVIDVEERPSISEITIDGNKAIKTEDLLKGLREQGMAEGRVFQRATLEGMQRELVRQYSAQGRYDAEITTDVVAEPRNRVAIEIVIDEGKPAKIRDINIVGNEVFSDKQLRKLMELKDRGWRNVFGSKKKYSREKLSGDLETINDYYLDRGYSQFRIESAQVSVGPKKDSVYINIVVDEGDRYTVDEISLAGDVKEQAPLLERSYLLARGWTFSQSLVTSTEELMKRIMGNQGYSFAEINSVPEINEEDKTVDITFVVEPGKRTYVRRIDFTGNRKTKDEVLRREMRQMEGAIASTDLIEASRKRLDRLGFFKEVKVDTPAVPGSDDLVDVLYTVEEQAFGSVSASLGYSQDVGFIFGANFEQNNFLGSGKQVTVQANRSRFRTNYALSYVNPYYTADGVSRGFSIFARETDYDEINISSFSTNSLGGSVIFGYPLSETQSLRFSVGYTHTEIETGPFVVQEIKATPVPIGSLAPTIAHKVDDDFFDASSSVAGSIFRLDSGSNSLAAIDDLIVAGLHRLDDDDLTALDDFEFSQPGFLDLYGDEFDLVTFTAGWRESTLNRGIFATRGHSNGLSLEVTSPGSEIEYYKLSFNSQYFVPLTRNLTLRLRAELGYGDGFGNIEELPFFENFYAGGLGSVRGFESNTLGPRSTSSASYVARTATLDSGTTVPVYIIDSNGNLLTSPNEFDTDPFGGNILAEGGIELIVPTPFAPESRSVRTVLFYDMGNVFNDSCRPSQINCSDLNFSEMRSSAGVTFTWLSGFGPLTFSLGFPLDKQEFDETEVFQFTLGGGF